MNLTKVEKLVFSFLILTLLTALMLLIVKIGNNKIDNGEIIEKINAVAELTDRTPAEKTVFFNEQESINKLNLNKADLYSLKTVPCLTAPLAKRIYEYVKNKGEVLDFNDLLEVKGMNKKRLRQLELYVTLLGGHSGSASWGSKIDLNFTTIDELKTATGISNTLAEKIINYRNTNGGFQSINDLFAIPGVSEKVVDSFIDKVEVK